MNTDLLVTKLHSGKSDDEFTTNVSLCEEFFFFFLLETEEELGSYHSKFLKYFMSKGSRCLFTFSNKCNIDVLIWTLLPQSRKV